MRSSAEILEDIHRVLSAPMREVLVGSEEEFREAMTSQKAEGWSFATMSNCGLPDGQHRVTFIPSDAFKAE